MLIRINTRGRAQVSCLADYGVLVYRRRIARRDGIFYLIHSFRAFRKPRIRGCSSAKKTGRTRTDAPTHASFFS